MTNVYVSSADYAAVAQFAASHLYSLGDYVRPLTTPAYGAECVYKCTTGGTSGAEPGSWTTTDGGTVTTGGATFTCVAGRESEQANGNWKAPYGTLAAAMTHSPAGTTAVYIRDNSTETNAATLFLGGSSSICVFCVNNSNVPPGDANDSTGAAVATSGANAINFRGFILCRGVSFTAGSAANAASITFGASSGGVNMPLMAFENCKLILGNTSTSSVIQFSSSNGGQVTLKNTTMKFGATGQSVQVSSNANVDWSDTASAIDNTGSIPTNLFTQFRGTMVIRGCDLSAVNTSSWGSGLDSGIGFIGQLYVYDCKISSSLTIQTGAPFPGPLSVAEFDNCDSGATNYVFSHVKQGVLITDDLVIARSGGATDGVTLYSHRYKQLANLAPNSGVPNLPFPQVGDWLSKRYNTTAVSKTLTLYLIAFSAAIPNNANLWVEMEALTDSGSPLAGGSTTRTKVPAQAGTNLSADTSAWDAGTVAARANSHAYSLNDMIKVASNPGRVFICTTAGTSAGSEPGGFATAVDGGSVTDNAAVFRAGWRCSIAISFTPQQAGMVRARMNGAQGTTGTLICLDPKLNIA